MQKPSMGFTWMSLGFSKNTVHIFTDLNRGVTVVSLKSHSILPSFFTSAQSILARITVNILTLEQFDLFLFSSYDPALLLHGQQYIEIYRPIPSRANVSGTPKLLVLKE